MVTPFLNNAEFFRGVAYGEQRGRCPLIGVSIACCPNLNQTHLHSVIYFSGWGFLPDPQPEKGIH